MSQIERVVVMTKNFFNMFTTRDAIKSLLQGVFTSSPEYYLCSDLIRDKHIDMFSFFMTIFIVL